MADAPRRSEVPVLWGHDIEGGAPAYWPWTQVLRSRSSDPVSPAMAVRHPADTGSPGALGRTGPRGDDWLVLRGPSGAASLAFQQVERLTPSTWPDDAIPQQLHLDLSVPTFQELLVLHERVQTLGGRVVLDRSHDPQEPLFVYADPSGHRFCIFVPSHEG